MHLVRLPWPPKALWPNGGRAHHMAHARAAKAYRQAAWGACKEAGVPSREAARLHWTFYAKPKGPKPDLDNCIAAVKAAQDGIADALGANDRAFQCTYEMADERAPLGAVLVTVASEDGEEAGGVPKPAPQEVNG